MEAHLIELSRRVDKLEQKFDIWQHMIGGLIDMPVEPERPLTSLERGRLLIERARRNAVRDSLHFSQVMEEMGIVDGPVLSRKELQQLYVEAGFDPEAAEFAQGIVAMREE